MKCPNCGGEVNSSRVCEYCGSEFPEMNENSSDKNSKFDNITKKIFVIIISVIIAIFAITILAIVLKFITVDSFVKNIFKRNESISSEIVSEMDEFDEQFEAVSSKIESGKDDFETASSKMESEMDEFDEQFDSQHSEMADYFNNMRDSFFDNNQTSVEITGARLTKTTDGKSAVIITYIFTNNSTDNSTSYFFTYSDKVYQDGISLTETIFIDDDEFKRDNLTRDIKSGASIEVEKAYVLSNKNSPIDVEVSERKSFNSSEVFKKSFTF